jgi:acyl carrier protein
MKAMQRTDALAQVVSIVAETLEIDEDRITEQASYAEDLDADSLDLVELVMAFEDSFEVEIPEDDLVGIKTVADTVDYLIAHSA